MANGSHTFAVRAKHTANNTSSTINILQIPAALLLAGLVSWWDGDLGSGTTACDLGSGNSGTLINGAITIRHDAEKFRHYGPMAQDFFAAFGYDGVGDDRHPDDDKLR